MFMANTRIRYKKVIFPHLGIQLRSNQYLCGQNLYHIIIDIQKLNAGIVLNEIEIIYTVEANTLSELKKKARAELVKLGAKFNQEIRNRGNTEKLVLENLTKEEVVECLKDSKFSDKEIEDLYMEKL